MEHVLEVRRVHMLAFVAPEAEDPLALGETIRAVAGGDREAFNRLYAAYAQMIRAILLGRVPPRDVTIYCRMSF